MANFGKIIADNLSALMKQSGIYAAELSRAHGIEHPVISRALAGGMANPTLKTLQLLATPFNKTAEWLITDHSKTQAGEHDLVECLRRISEAALGSRTREKKKIAAVESPMDRLVELVTTLSEAEILHWLEQITQTRATLKDSKDRRGKSGKTA